MIFVGPVAGDSWGQSIQDQKASLFGYLTTQKALQLTVVTDLRELLKKKDIYQEAELLMMSGKDTIIQHRGEIRTRGHSRKDICLVPPTKLRFQKQWLKNLGLEDYPTLKLVNACAQTDRDENYVLAEHLIYKLNAVVTKNSFRTHRVSIKYIDENNPKKTLDVGGYMIEHEDELAARLAGSIYQGRYFGKEALDRQAYLDFCVFQYMIGNTDWKVLNQHNIKIITVPSLKKVYPIAYDFDYAGLVNTHYAVPHEGVNIRDVGQRIYLGLCQNEEEVRNMCQKYLDAENEILDIVKHSKLSKHQLKYCIRYLTKFFDTIKDEQRAMRVFTKCIDY